MKVAAGFLVLATVYVWLLAAGVIGSPPRDAWCDSVDKQWPEIVLAPPEVQTNYRIKSC